MTQHCNRFFLASNDEADSQCDQCKVLSVLEVPEEMDYIVHYFYEMTCELIKVKLYLLTDNNTKFVDIFWDVLHYIPLHWSVTELVCEFEVLM